MKGQYPKIYWLLHRTVERPISKIVLHNVEKHSLKLMKIGYCELKGVMKCKHLKSTRL